MTPCPKPPRRGRRPPRPIRRTAWPRRARVGRARSSFSGRRCPEDAKALALFSRFVRLRSPICQRCERRDSREAHHPVPRDRDRYRYDVDRGVALCWRCHKDVTEDGHENRLLGIKLFGAEEWERMQVLKRLPCRVDPALAIVALTARLAELERGGR